MKRAAVALAILLTGSSAQADEDRDVQRKYGAGSAWMQARYARTIDPAKMGGLAHLLAWGVSARAVLGKDVGYAGGLGFELGATSAGGFAHQVELLPLGLGMNTGGSGFFGLFSGVGMSGVTSRVQTALELPAELRIELDVGKSWRWAMDGRLVWVPGSDARRHGAPSFSFADEWRVASWLRFGEAHRKYGGAFGNGNYFGFEYREQMGTRIIGFLLGVQLTFAG